MNNLNATTPQLKCVDRFYEAYTTCDINKVAPLLSKNYMYRSFPKIPELPDQTKEEHIREFGPLFARLVKLEHTFGEVVEAPGKVAIQWTAHCTPPDGATFEYDSVAIITIVEEDGELKILEFKDFTDPEKRSNFHKTLSQEKQIA